MAEQFDNHKFEASGDSRPKNIQEMDKEYLTSTDEPEFEFDDYDTELSSTKEGDFEAEIDEELGKNSQGGAFGGGTITPDGLIDEDFERELGTPEEEEPREFSDADRLGFVEVAGDDLYGRKVIIVSACKLPSNKVFDHQRLLEYIKYTLDKYVEQDYVLVYFHHGLNSRNRPKLSWLVQAYREFDRKYKKNLKTLYLVHPTNFIKVLWKIFRPIISAKFGQKMMYVNCLEDLKHHLPFDQLSIPAPVLEFDAKKVSRRSSSRHHSSSTEREQKKTQLFGLSLNDIKFKTGRVIPLPVEEAIEYLKATGGDEVDGLFRRCARVTTMKEVHKKYDNGEKVDFHEYSDPHLAAAILKTFLRELQEPLMTYDLFDKIADLNFQDSSKQVTQAQKLLQHDLPEDNYTLLKYVFQFLQQVVSKSDINHMTAENIAIVFGPNISWTRGQANLTTVEHSVKFVLILVKNFHDVFLK